MRAAARGTDWVWLVRTGWFRTLSLVCRMARATRAFAPCLAHWMSRYYKGEIRFWSVGRLYGCDGEDAIGRPADDLLPRVLCIVAFGPHAMQRFERQANSFRWPARLRHSLGAKTSQPFRRRAE
jgi:hypothetical protein